MHAHCKFLTWTGYSHLHGLSLIYLLIPFHLSFSMSCYYTTYQLPNYNYYLGYYDHRYKRASSGLPRRESIFAMPASFQVWRCITHARHTGVQQNHRRLGASHRPTTRRLPQVSWPCGASAVFLDATQSRHMRVCAPARLACLPARAMPQGRRVGAVPPFGLSVERVSSVPRCFP